MIAIGGGMVGASCALAAAQQGFQVVLLEHERPGSGWSKDSVDLRVSALTRISQQLLHNLSAWSRMAEQRVTPYQTMTVWEKAGIGEVNFHAADLGEPDLGHIVENRVITHALWQLIEQEQRIDVRLGEALSSLENTDQISRLGLTDGNQLPETDYWRRWGYIKNT